MALTDTIEKKTKKKKKSKKKVIDYFNINKAGKEFRDSLDKSQTEFVNIFKKQ